MALMLVTNGGRWLGFNPDAEQSHGDPIVEFTPEAKTFRDELDIRIDALIGHAKGDIVQIQQALWGRALEKIVKLAILGAVSLDQPKPVITPEILQHCWTIVEHSTRRLIWLAHVYTGRSEYELLAKRLEAVIRRQSHHKATKSVLLKAVGQSVKDVDQTLETMVQAKILDETKLAPKPGQRGRPPVIYTLLAA